nr:putative reverse transcriptase domain-containing protein [Tanacetum cinerariifolium]
MNDHHFTKNTESFATAAARAPRGHYDFVDTIEVGQGLIRSPGHDAQTIARAVDREEEVGYVRALHASEHRMMTSIKEVNLRISYQAQVRRYESKHFYTQLHDAQTNRRDIRLEIDVVRGQRTAYETELQEVRQAYLSSEAQNRALLARLETLKTHMSHMEWQCQSAEDLAATQMMHIHALEARTRTDTVEDAGSSRHDAAYAMTWGTLKKKLIDKYCPKGEIKKLEIELWNLRVKGNDVAAYTQRFQKLALMCTKFLADETEKVDKCISGLPDNIHGNVMSARPKTLDETIELANDLMDQKLRTYVERQNDNKRKADDSLRNNQQHCYASILFDTGADRSFISTAFSALLNIAPTALDNHYDVELADEKIIGVNTILRGCTLEFLNHPFNIDLMLVPLGSFDVIIGMDWLREYHKEAKDKSKGKRLEYMPIIRDFHEDLSGIPPARQTIKISSLIHDYGFESSEEILESQTEALKPENLSAEDVGGMLRKDLSKEKIQAARDRQKSYADLKRKPMDFQVSDRGMLKVLSKVGDVAYILELPQQLSRVYTTFHVSNLKKCLSDESLMIPLEELRVDDKLHFVEEPIKVMDRETKRLKRSCIPIIKVRWNSKRGHEFTWEREDQFKQKYPHLFTKTAPSTSVAS